MRKKYHNPKNTNKNDVFFYNKNGNILKNKIVWKSGFYYCPYIPIQIVSAPGSSDYIEIYEEKKDYVEFFLRYKDYPIIYTRIGI